MLSKIEEEVDSTYEVLKARIPVQEWAVLSGPTKYYHWDRLKLALALKEMGKDISTSIIQEMEIVRFWWRQENILRKNLMCYTKMWYPQIWS